LTILIGVAICVDHGVLVGVESLHDPAGLLRSRAVSTGTKCQILSASVGSALKEEYVSDLAPKGDVVAVIARSVVGAIPIFGQLATELVDQVVPNQRIDRIERLLHELDSRVDRLDPAGVRAKVLGEPLFTDLVEDAFWSAARAVSQERIEYVASLLTESLSVESVRAVEYKTLFRILGELNDVEVIMLSAHLMKNARDHEFHDRHKAALDRHFATMGAPQEVHDRAAVQNAHTEHLVRLGLLEPRYKVPKKGELPEFDRKTGMLEAHGHQLTSLGRLLLRSIGLATDREF
jgi:hypothetical protein